MNKNTNRIKNFWNTIGKGIVALTLSLTLGVTSIVACANSFVKLLERKKSSLSISTTETTTSNTELDIEPIIQTTIPTLEKTESIIETIEPTIETTIPNVIDTEQTPETTITIPEINESTIKTDTTISNISINNSLNKIDIEKYIKDIDSIEVNYKHKEYYPTKNDTFKIYADATTTATKCEYEFDGNTETIVNKLFENSKKYISENPNYVMPFKDENSQNEELIAQQLNFETTLYQLLNNWKNNTNEINEDFCTLENYSIVFSFDEEEHKNLLAYTTLDTLVIFPERIQTQASKFNENWKDLLYTVMNHQLNIIRQRACKCRIYRGQSYLQIPTKTLTTATTESETKYYNDPSMYSLNYYDEKQSEELLLTLGLFRDGVTYDDYYNAIYNSDLESLHTFFNATTEEDVNKLYNILYAIDAVNLKNDLLFTQYDKSDLISTNEIRSFVGHSYKIEIFKNVLKNMIQYSNDHNDFTIEENLIMFNLIKSFIIKDSYEILDVDLENSTTNIRYEDDFTENIYSLNNIYLEFLSNKYGLSIEKIQELESDNINGPLLYIQAYCQNDYNIIPERYYYTVENLVNRFPILKAMFNTTKTLAYEYENFEHITLK